MAIGADVLISNDNKKVNDMDILIDNSLKKITKAYVLKKGELYLWWGGEKITGFVIFENGVFNHVPEEFDIDNYVDDNTDITNLSEYYLTENLLWVHDASIVTPWDVIGLNIDSQYFDYDNQDALNAIYIPINRIINPEKLKITARGNFLVDIGYINLEQNVMELYSIDYLICNNNFHEYIIDLSPNSIIDYIAIKNIEKKEQSEDTLINYDGEVNYFILPIHVHKNEISYDEVNTLGQVYNWNFHVTEGNAYGLFIQNKNSSGSFHVCFFSGEPFTVEFLDRSTHRNMVYRVHNPYNYFSKEGRPFYCRFIFGTSYTEEHISNLSVDFTLYENSNIDALIIDQNSDSQLTVELGSIITSGFIEQDNSSIEQDPSNILSLQQISRIEVVGGEEQTQQSTELDEIISNNLIVGYWEQPIQFVTAGDNLTFTGKVNPTASAVTYSLIVPENCVGCIVHYTSNQYGYMLFSKNAFGIPNIHVIDSNGEHDTGTGGGSGSPRLQKTIGTPKYAMYSQSINYLINSNVEPTNQLLEFTNGSNEAYWELAYIADQRDLL